MKKIQRKKASSLKQYTSFLNIALNEIDKDFLNFLSQQFSTSEKVKKAKIRPLSPSEATRLSMILLFTQISDLANLDDELVELIVSLRSLEEVVRIKISQFLIDSDYF